MPSALNLAGVTVGRLTVIRRAGDDGHGHITWECSCSCGGTTTASGPGLKRGKPSSCGCLRREAARRNGVLSHGPATHGGTLAFPSEYAIWKAMIRRATGKGSAKDRELYFGVTICERWRWSFENFMADMGPRPFAGASLDRHPNRDGGYEPGNVRWATPVEQANNRRPRRCVSAVAEAREKFQKGANQS